MNKLSNCELWMSYKEWKKDIPDLLKPEQAYKYEIPSSFYDSWYSPLSAKKYPLLRQTLKMAKDGRIHLVNFADPKDNSVKPILIHPSISAFLGMDNKKKINAFVNAAEKTGFIRNSDKEAVGVRLDENHLYGYLQTGYTAILLAEKDSEITNNVKFQQDMAEVYSSLLAAVIDNIYPISSERDAYPRLVFLCALFYLQFMAGYSEDKAVTVALKLKNVDPVVVGNKCRALELGKIKMTRFSSIPEMDKSGKPSENGGASFIDALKCEFPFINLKDFGLREVASGWTKKYGPASYLAIEHFQTLLNMIQHVGLRTGLYADFNLTKMIPNTLIQDINKILSLMSGE